MSIDVQGVNKKFGDFVALDDVSVSIPTGQLTALLGPSGGGKSTLLRIIAGRESPDAGEVQRARRIRLGYLTQEASFHSRHTLREALLEVFSGLRQQAQRLRELEAALAAAGTDPAA